MKLLFTILLILFLAAFAVPATARTLTPVEGLEALRLSFAGMNDFTADLVQVKHLSIMKKKLVMQGRIRFRKPDLFFMELVPPYTARVLLRDAVLQQKMGENGELQRIVLPSEQGLSHWFATVAKPVTRVPDGMEIRADKTGQLTTISIKPTSGGQLKELTVFLHNDGTVRKLLLLERTGDRTEMNFQKIKRNVGLTVADFSLE